MQCHLLYGSDARQDLQGLLEADDLELVLSSNHRPYCIIQFISESLKLLNLQETKMNLLVSFPCFSEVSAMHLSRGRNEPFSRTTGNNVVALLVGLGCRGYHDSEICFKP